MLTLLVGPLVLFLVAAFGVAALLGFQFGRIASGEVVATAKPALAVVINDKINHLHRGFGLFFKYLGHYLLFSVLLIMRRLIVVFKALTIIAEKRFSRLIESVRGRGVVGKRGSTSLFLSALTSADQAATRNTTPRS